MKTKSIKQSITFDATPDELYEVLMNAKKHGALTASKVKMSNKVKGKFDVFDGYCHGYNIELEANKKIVQAWHFAEEGWPADHFSICTFSFEQVKNKTKLVFTQTGIPEHKAASLKSGWATFYWEPLKEFFSTKWAS